MIKHKVSSQNFSHATLPEDSMSRTPDRHDRPDALTAAAALPGLAELFSAGLTVVWKDEWENLLRDRQTLAAKRKELVGLRLEVLLLQTDLDRCRHQLELCRGW